MSGTFLTAFTMYSAYRGVLKPIRKNVPKVYKWWKDYRKRRKLRDKKTLLTEIDDLDLDKAKEIAKDLKKIKKGMQ